MARRQQLLAQAAAARQEWVSKWGDATAVTGGSPTAEAEFSVTVAPVLAKLEQLRAGGSP